MFPNDDKSVEAPQNAYFSLIGKIAFLIGLALVLSSLMVLYIDPLPSNTKEGAIARHDVKADQNYELVDERATQQLREEAMENINPVYDFDDKLSSDYVINIEKGFEKGRKTLENWSAEEESVATDAKERELKLRQEFQLGMGLALSDEVYEDIREDGFSGELSKILVSLLAPIQKQPVLYDENELLVPQEKGIVVRKSSQESAEDEDVINDYSQILRLKDARQFYAGQSASDLKKKFYLDFSSNKKIKLAKALFPNFLKVNLRYNQSETELRREKASANIQNVIYKLQKGQVILRRGDRYEPWHLTVFQRIREARMQTNMALKFVGVFLLCFFALSVLMFFSAQNIKNFILEKKDFYFLGTVLVGFMGFLRLAVFVAGNLQGAIPYIEVDITTFYYLIPMAAGAMLVRFTLNSEASLVYISLVSLMAGLFLENNLTLGLYYFVSGVAASHFMAKVEKRSTIFRIGIYLGLINAALVLSLDLFQMAAATNLDHRMMLVNALFAFFGGLSASLMMLAISPLFEAMFGYTTNIQLLELANMNHPLLREMIVRAPGTYHHSQLVGILAEAGAREIGANPLLARVGSYYHDIGKMKKPQYFIENQKGENPHDHLTPSMSALIIEAHVKDGVDMAREYKLPEVIVNFIPEHQGTKLIGFFHKKAKEMMGPNDPEIDEQDFRYKGPVPQTRESAIVMLADTVEAAVRSLADKSPEKIQETVEKLVDYHFTDGQLNGCDITLKDLHKLVEAFEKILVAMYHQRVEYNRSSPSESERNDGSDSTDPDSLDQQSSQMPNITQLFKK